MTDTLPLQGLAANRTETDAIAALASRAAGILEVPDELLFQPHILQDVDGKPHVLDLSRYARVPRDVHADVAFSEVESWLLYIERFRTPETILFGYVDDARVKAIFDYHADSRTPGLARNAATYRMLPSEQWTAWQAIDGNLLNQDAFAEHLVERRGDILKPDAATMLELAQTFHATLDTQFKSKVSLETGAVTFLVDEQVHGAGMVGEKKVTAPQTITLRMPVTQGGDPIELTARLRWRAGRDGLKLGVTIERTAEVWRDAFTRAVERIEAETGIPVLR